MKNRLMRLLVMALMVGSVLTACGGEHDKTGVTESNTDAPVNQSVENIKESGQEIKPEMEPESEVVFDENYYDNFKFGRGLVDGECLNCFLDFGRESDLFADAEVSEDVDLAIAGIYSIHLKEEGYIAEFKKVYVDFRLCTKDEIIMITKDGQEDLWVYDAENATFSNGEVTFYEREKAFFENELSESEYLLSGTYVGTYHGRYSTPYALSKEGDYGVEFVFNENGSASATIDGEWGFCGIEKYSIRGNKIYALTYEETLLIGEIDEITGMVTINDVELTKVQ